MKAFLTLLVLISNVTLLAQTQDVAGNYEFISNATDGNKFEYKLNLAPDGTFSLHYYSYIRTGIPPESHKSGKGTWTVQNNVLTFNSDKQKDIDEKNTLDFTNTKARLLTKSPRDTTDKVVKTRLKFLSSGISWMKGIELFRI